MNNLEISRYIYNSKVDRHLYYSDNEKLNLLFLIRNLKHRQCKRIFTNLYKISIITIHPKN